MRSLIVLAALFASMGAASAATWIIGDDDGFGTGIPNGANHTMAPPIYDGRSAAEMAATNGAQFTDTYSTSQPGYSPQTGMVSTFTFSGLGSGWAEGNVIFDLADFEASAFGPVLVTFNGMVQNWAFNDGFLTTKVRAFELEQAVLDQINLTGSLVVVIDRNLSGDFYGIDYAGLTDDNDIIVIPPTPAIPEPSTYAMLALGLAAIIGVTRRRRSR
ncbi:MAG TPA: PEP-CTERM sorting domain-containing protein [Rubrivivax sp.]